MPYTFDLKMTLDVSLPFTLESYLLYSVCIVILVVCHVHVMQHLCLASVI